MRKPKVPHLLRVALATGLLIFTTPNLPSNAQNSEANSISNQLEIALNNQNIESLKDFISEENRLEIKSSYTNFIQTFPNLSSIAEYVRTKKASLVSKFL